jgi:hypothetical protein
VTLARFTHHKNNVIYASTKEDGNIKIFKHGIDKLTHRIYLYIYLLDTLRYLSVYDNKYIRYFRGHKKRFIILFNPLLSQYTYFFILE